MRATRAEPRTQRRWRRRLGLVAAVAVVGAVAHIAGFQPAVSQLATVNAYAATDDPGMDPGAGPWARIPGVSVPMTAQAQTYPFGGDAVPAVDVRALHWNGNLFVRVEWADSTKDDSSFGMDRFADAAAIQFPAVTGAAVPALCMGQVGAGVNIWQWRADSQAGVPQSLGEEDPNGYADYYPITDDLGYPARYVGNPYDIAGQPAAQNLVAAGFGTLTATPEHPVTAAGAYDGNRWAVVFTRSLASPGDGQPNLVVGDKTDIAAAAWNGAHQDRNGQKAVSQFVSLQIGTDPVPPDRTPWIVILLLGGLAVGVIASVVVWRMAP
ncbi:MAG: ethylbenzene dehydrogenase-related protein [Acidimicrobiia bacterium]